MSIANLFRDNKPTGLPPADERHLAEEFVELLRHNRDDTRALAQALRLVESQARHLARQSQFVRERVPRVAPPGALGDPIKFADPINYAELADGAGVAAGVLEAHAGRVQESHGAVARKLLKTPTEL